MRNLKKQVEQMKSTKGQDGRGEKDRALGTGQVR